MNKNKPAFASGANRLYLQQNQIIMAPFPVPF